MSKKRNHKVEQKTAPQQMRSRETARAVKALRSAETAKFRKQLVQLFQLYNQEVDHGLVQNRHRKTQNRKSVQTSVPRRNLPSDIELSKSNLSKEVRDVIQDGKRSLACARRRTRRELMFAMQRAGVQGRNNKKATWTNESYLRCK